MEQRQPKLFCALDDIDQIRLLNQSINEAYVLKGKKPESEQVLNAVEKLRKIRSLVNKNIGLFVKAGKEKAA